MHSLMRTPPERPSQAVSRALSLALSASETNKKASSRGDELPANTGEPSSAAAAPSGARGSYREVLVNGSDVRPAQGPDLLLEPVTPRAAQTGKTTAAVVEGMTPRTWRRVPRVTSRQDEAG